MRTVRTHIDEAYELRDMKSNVAIAHAQTTHNYEHWDLDVNTEDAHFDIYTITAILRITTCRNIVTTKIPPNKWIDGPKWSQINTITVPVNSFSYNLALRAGHSDPYNRGSFIVDYDKPVSMEIYRIIKINTGNLEHEPLCDKINTILKRRLTTQDAKTKLIQDLMLPYFLKNLGPKDVKEVGGKHKDEMCGPMLKGKHRILTSYGSNLIARVPMFVTEFFNTYVAGLNRKKGSKLQVQVKNWYQGYQPQENSHSPRLLLEECSVRTQK